MQAISGKPGWDDRSRILAVALTQLEEETGPEGYPIALETDPDSNGWWQADEVVNEAVAERERYMKEHGKSLEPGTAVFIRYTGDN